MRKKGIFRRWESDEKFRYKATYFIAVVAVVGIVLGAIASVDPQVPPLQRAIAGQTSMVLNAFGIPSETYDYWVEVHTPSLSPAETKEIEIALAKLTLTIERSGTKLVAYNNYLTREEGEALHAYLGALRSRGVQARFEPATVVTPAVTVNIIPGCTAWLGIAAITALILAYPGSTRARKLQGLAIAWAAMHCANILRLFTTIAATNWLGAWTWPILEPLIWRWGMVAFALVIWALWLGHMAGDAK